MMGADMYIASYDFGDIEVSQVGVVLIDGALDDNNYSGLRELIENLMQQFEQAGASLSVQRKDGKFSRYLRVHGQVSQQTLLQGVQALLQHPSVAKAINSREAFDHIFSQPKTKLGLIPNSVYRAQSVEMVTDYVIAGEFDEILNVLHLNQFDFCYQINFGLLHDKSESLKFVRKSLVRLEESPSVPKKLILQQRRFNRRSDKCRWVAEEYFASDEVNTFEQIQDLVSQCFAEEHLKLGFPALQLESGEAAEDQFYTGLHSRQFEPVSAAEEASQLLSDDNLNSLLGLVLPKDNLPEDTETESAMPRAVSNEGRWDVFLSHSSKDHLVTKAVCHYLEQQGVRCWMAPRDIPTGDLWSHAIMQGIKFSKITLLVLSTPSNDSRYVLREIEQSVTLGHMIIPLRIEDIIPSDSLNFFVSSHHWFDAVSTPLEEQLPVLCEAILPHLMP